MTDSSATGPTPQEPGAPRAPREPAAQRPRILLAEATASYWGRFAQDRYAEPFEVARDRGVLAPDYAGASWPNVAA